MESRRKRLLAGDFSDSERKSFLVSLEGDPSVKAAENDRFMPRDGVWSGVGGIRALRASTSLEGMAILRGVTGVAEVRGREAWAAHIISNALICKSQTIPHIWVTSVIYLSNTVISVALTRRDEGLWDERVFDGSCRGRLHHFRTELILVLEVDIDRLPRPLLR